jgi:predicted PurR-regulated permease PerM
VVLAFITSAAGWVAFSIIGLPSPLALAVWAGVVAQFVPVIGTYIGGALPVAIALLDDPVKALWVIGYLIVFQQLEIYVLSPRIAARAMAIHPAVAFAAAITGAEILGPVGAFLALPAAAIIQAFVSSYLQRYELVDEPLIAEAPGESPSARPPG